MAWNESECAKRGEKIMQIEKRLDKLDAILERVNSRLPHWATLTIAILLAAVAWFAKG
jgi:hypothetical protein